MKINISKSTIFQRIDNKSLLIFVYYPFKIIGYLFLILVSWLMYPNYNIFFHPISNLGNWYLNPTGWIYFSLASIWEGILLIPFFVFLNRILRRIMHPVAYIGTALNLIGAIGLIIISFFPNVTELKLIHNLGASLAFNGFFIGNVLYWGILVKYIRDIKLGLFRTIVFLMSTILIPILTGIFIYQFLYANINNVLNTYWEWIMFFLIILQSFTIYILIPNPNKL
ncbi:MAG: DUF998 domain-containing protein [Candidatus Helarchaeota archaeon]